MSSDAMKEIKRIDEIQLLVIKALMEMAGINCSKMNRDELT